MSGNDKAYYALLAGFLILLATFFLRRYFVMDATFWIGVCIAPFAWMSSSYGKRTWRLAPCVALLLAGSFFTTAMSVRYLLISCSILFLVESYRGRVNVLIFCVLSIISPLFTYLSQIFTFPIRLLLSEWAGIGLRLARISAEVSGNVISVNGSEFIVDPACMGLQMTGFSLLSVIFFTTSYQWTSKKEAKFSTVFIALTFAFVLNVFANLVRILVLVLFEIPSESFIHDLTGLVILICYVWIPLSFITRYLFKRFAGAFPKPELQQSNTAMNAVFYNGALLLLCTFLVFYKPDMQSNPDFTLQTRDNYKATRLKNGILRYQNESALIYLKGIPSFYSTEHNPYVCWRGSGFKFRKISEEVVSGYHVYTGILENGKDRLHTAWWFSNSKHMTISQLDWRLRDLKGESKFHLVNVTAANPRDLNLAVKEWLSGDGGMSSSRLSHNNILATAQF